MRPFLVWREDWLLGFERLDDQHLSLAQTLNTLHRFLVHDDNRKPLDREQLCRQLDGLLEMTRGHFQDEESLMQDHDYPGLQAHHREHALLLAELQECIREIEAGRKPFTLATLTALKHWQIDHVINSGAEFTQFIL